jgi:type II secretory pathway pseudopilin PulG
MDAAHRMASPSRSRAHARRAARQPGFTYLGVLFFVLAFGLGLASVALVWRNSVQRERETELLFVGKQYRQAIASYYASGQREFPARLEDLLLDPRYPEVRRHLRRLYRDPMTGATEWGLVKVGERIVGVYSLGAGMPLKEVPSGSPDDPPIGGTSYSEWKFIVDPKTQGQGAVAPDPRAALQVPPQGVPAAPADNKSDPATSDACEQAQEAAIARCHGAEASKNRDFQSCVMDAFQQFQKCKGAS